MSVTYRADVDGLRAIAVAAVVLYHANPDWLPAGYLGVDVFFVISGFLIGGLLLEEIAQGQFRYRSFLMRRMRRLYPALIVMLGVSAGFGAYLLVPEDAEDFGESLAAAAAFVSNFMFFTEDGYFEPIVEFQPLLHTWSLGVEEQFYLVFPWLLVLTAARGRRAVSLVLSLVCGTSLALWWWQSEQHSQAAFYLLPARIWELLVGALIALHGRDSKSGLLQVLAGLSARHHRIYMSIGVIGLVLIGCALSGALGTGTRLAMLGCCAGAALLIIGGMRPGSLVSTILSMPVLVGMGLISYSLYLWHWPALVFAKHYLVRSLSISELVMVISGSFVLAYLSWRFVESPFRGAGGKLSNSLLLRLAGVTAAAVVGFGLLLDQTGGWPGRYDRDTIMTLVDVAVSERRECVGLPPAAINASSLCRVGYPDVQATAAIWGDSHAAGFVPLLGRLAVDQRLNLVSATAYGCAPLTGVARVVRDPKRPCQSFNERILDVLIEEVQITHVILAARWAAHASGEAFGLEGSAVTYLTDGQHVASSKAENVQLFRRGLEASVERLARAGKQVYVLDSVPEIGRPIPKLMLQQQMHQRFSPLSLPEPVFRLRQRDVRPIMLALDARPEVMVFDISRRLCSDGECAGVIADKPLYSDTNHLSKYGLVQVRPVFVALLEQITTGHQSTAQIAQEQFQVQ